MESITYLDNAATTALDPIVLEAMMPFMTQHFGNPSSAYALGRTSRQAIEASRKRVAEILGVRPTSIFFTSGGTESNNTAIATAVHDLGCKHIITSPIEHHAVLHTVVHYCRQAGITYSFVALDDKGKVNLQDLDQQLQSKKSEGIKCLVSLMHANNEIGTLLDLKQAGEICARYDSIFHSDCVQTIGHYQINLNDYHIHFASASGHKFHGPKGTGILYIREGMKASPLIHGGSQERRMRAGTENVHGIIGFAKALELSASHFEHDQSYIQGLSNRLKNGLKLLSEEISFNNADASLYTVLSVNFPAATNTDFLLSYFDRAGICVSGGSACSAGEEMGSHVINAIRKNAPGATIRFSFSKQTTEGDIDLAIKTARDFLKVPVMA